MILEIAGVVGAITGPLYGLVISLMRSYSSMNREIGEIGKDVEIGNRDIGELRRAIEKNVEAIRIVESSLEEIKKSPSWKPEEESQNTGTQALINLPTHFKITQPCLTNTKENR